VAQLEKLGAEPTSSTPEQFAKLYREEHDSWKAVIQRAGIKAE
jgi:tripartite-type tricarboxylate transporter receptor subunit TctC